MHENSDNSWITLKSLLLWLNNFVNSPRSPLWPVSQTALIPSLVNVDLWFWFSSSAFACSVRSLLHCLLHLLMSFACVMVDMFAGVFTPLFLHWEWGLGLLFYLLLSLNNFIWSHDFKCHLQLYGPLTAPQIFLTSMLRYLRPLNHLHSIFSSHLNLRMFKKVFKTEHLTPSYEMFVSLVFPD